METHYISLNVISLAMLEKSGDLLIFSDKNDELAQFFPRKKLTTTTIGADQSTKRDSLTEFEKTVAFGSYFFFEKFEIFLNFIKNSNKFGKFFLKLFRIFMYLHFIF